jgi:glutaredoxin-related protein
MKHHSIAIVQSNYIPWKGYFDLIRSVDAFVLYDEVQYTKADWRNRNQIKTKQGLQWLSIPVRVKGRYFQKISDTEVVNNEWAELHWRTLCQAYARAPHFGSMKPWLEETFHKASQLTRLSEINREFISSILRFLDVRTNLMWSDSVPKLSTGKNERLIEICRHFGATVYLSGPAANTYLQKDLFKEQGIRIEFADYANYPIYPQLHGAFEHSVSILDLLFNTGSSALDYLKPAGVGTRPVQVQHSDTQENAPGDTPHEPVAQ